MSLETGPSAPVANPAAPSPSPSTGQKLQFLSEQIEDDEAMLELLGEQDEDIAEPEGGELEDDDEEDIPPDTDPSLCACCAEDKKVEKSIYCAECKKAYNNIDKAEAKETQRKGERWQRWQETKRCGGAPLNSALMSYRHDCEASKGPGHPRGKFDLGHHFEQMDSIARVETGEKLVYMPFARWIKHGPEQLGMDAKEAKDKWLRKKKNTATENAQEDEQGGPPSPHAV